MLGNLSINKKLVLVLLLPVAVAIMFSGFTVFRDYSISREMKHIEALAEISPEISALVHEMQKERGISAGFIGSNGAGGFQSRLDSQKTLTDKALLQLKEHLTTFNGKSYGEDFENSLKQALDGLGPLADMRGRVASLDASVADMAGYYTKTIAGLLSIIEEMVTLSTDGPLSNWISGYVALLQAKERAGIERAMGANGFGSGKFPPAIHQRFLSLIAQQQAYLDSFRVSAPEPLVEELDTFLKTAPAVAEVQAMRDVAIKAGYGAKTQGIKGVDWFDTITKKIEGLKVVEDLTSKDLLAYARKLDSEAQRSFYIALAVMLAGVAAAILLAVVVGREMSASMRRLLTAVDALGHGDKSVAFHGHERRDEIGVLSRAMIDFQKGLVEADRLEAEQKASQEAEVKRSRLVAQLSHDFESIISLELEKLTTAGGSLDEAAVSMNSVANDTQRRATDVVSATGQVNANVQNVSAAVEELSASIEEIGAQISRASSNADNARTEAESTHKVVQELAQATRQIDDVMSMITDIAEQTNLLALNATIEAARAGEAGKGFAVVAHEVKSLANQTANATDRISSLVRNIQTISGQAVESIRQISGKVTEISENTNAIAAGVEQQSAATRDIASSVAEAARGVESVTGNIGEVSSGSSQTLGAGEMVIETAETLNRTMETVREQIDAFLHKVRAA